MNTTNIKYRRDLGRPLTVEEADGNMDILDAVANNIVLQKDVSILSTDSVAVIAGKINALPLFEVDETYILVFRCVCTDISGLVKNFLLKPGRGAYGTGGNVLAETDIIAVNPDDPRVSSVTKISQTSAEIRADASTTAANTYTAAISPAITAYTDGLEVNVKFLSANTGAATLNLNGIGARNITMNGAAVASGEIASGRYRKLIFNSTANAWGIIGGQDISGKLNAGANTSLAGTGFRLIIAAADGTPTVDAELVYNPTTNEFTVGSASSVGAVTVNNTSFLISVLSTIANGLAKFEVNSDKLNALYFGDKSGNVYMQFDTVNKTIASRQKRVLSRDVLFDMVDDQAVITTPTAAGAKSYGYTSGGALYVLPFNTSGQAMVFEVSFLFKKSTGSGNTDASAVIAGRFRTVARRIGAATTITAPAVEITENTAGFTPAFGVEQVGNNLQVFFTPNASETNAYLGAFFHIKYVVN